MKTSGEGKHQALEEIKRIYDINEKLGEGTYGVVYKARVKNSDPAQIVALKKIKIDPNDEGIPATTIRELSLLIECKHPCIVKLEKSLCIKGELWLVFEFVKNDLKKYLDSLRALLKPRDVKILSYMLIEGVKFCHARRILHRDLKPQNILVSDNGQLKIADFGLGREHGLPIAKLTHEVVTLWYRPPEILLGQEKYSGACDMWGVGCIIGEMATRQALFTGDCEIDQLFQIFQILGTPDENDWPGVTSLPDYKPNFPKWKSKDLSKKLRNRFDQNGIDLIKQLLAYAPNQRITAKRALEHPWFDEIRDIMQLRYSSFHKKQEQLFQALQMKHNQTKQAMLNNNNNSNSNSNSNNNSSSSSSNSSSAGNQENINPNQSNNNGRMQSSYDNDTKMGNHGKRRNNVNHSKHKPMPMDQD